MRLYRYIMLLLMVLSSIDAATLKEIIESTLKNNQNIKASMIDSRAKEKIYNSRENIYNPTLNAAISDTQLNIDTREIEVKNRLVGSLKLGVDLYDGGKSSATKRQKSYEYQASKLDAITTKKETILQVVTLFFQTKTAIDSIEVLKEKGTTLKAQYQRVKTKYDINMVTIDEVLKLRSEYETNQYAIEELRYQKEELLETISLLAGRKIKSIDNSTLPNVKNLALKESEHLRSLNLSLKALDENVKIVESAKNVQVKLEDSLNLYSYNDYNENLLADLPQTQNQLNVSLTYRLFDTTTKHQVEAAKLAKLSAKEKVIFAKNQERSTFSLAKRKLKTQQLKINSLKSAVEMGESVYKLVKVKYQNGTVDNITYLDALSKRTFNKALYQQALNEYEIAKANYYFSSGLDYKKVLKGW
ncbi:Probable outer membrane component of multidrug efflux pump [hydrothermal vent metagenome]|uniref:Probable outer membrane component of multidrug efflux pump n=1 Tax=hydrothermal vent metagenome TaxID=652676 RepID=A0A1W1BJ12_9ZZZZ